VSSGLLLVSRTSCLRPGGVKTAPQPRLQQRCRHFGLAAPGPRAIAARRSGNIAHRLLETRPAPHRANDLANGDRCRFRPIATVREPASSRLLFVLGLAWTGLSQGRQRDRRDGFRHSHSEATQPCRTRSAGHGRCLPAARSARSRVWRGGIDDLDAEGGEPSDNRDACIFREVRRPRQQSLVVAAAVPCLS
jgi:hypothetical protein